VIGKEKDLFKRLVLYQFSKLHLRWKCVPNSFGSRTFCNAGTLLQLADLQTTRSTIIPLAW
jgi:hypothetical protein